MAMLVVNSVKAESNQEASIVDSIGKGLNCDSVNQAAGTIHHSATACKLLCSVNHQHAGVALQEIFLI